MSQNRGRDQSYIVKTFRNNSAQFYEHDDRASRGTRHRQANFKPRGKFLRGRGRYQPSLDDDSEMGGRRPHMQYGDDRRRGMRGRGRARAARGRGGGPPGRHPTNASLSSWFKVIIRFGQTYGKEFVVNALNDNLPEPFVPIGYTNEPNQKDVFFYVENKAMADTLYALDQRIQTPNGFKMRIVTRRSEPPMLTVDDAVKAELQLALSNRYTPANRTLDLAEFQNDRFIRSKGLYLPLWRQNVISAITDIIVANIPEVLGINLSKNKLTSLMPFKPLKNSCAELKALDLSHNSMSTIGLLDALAGMPLIELNLDGNKLCDSFGDKAEYISAVRKRFPKVMLLDNVELPPPIEFDLEDEATATKKLPESKSSFFCGTQPREISLMFLKQYFDVFDADKRDALIDAYHDQCRFSLSVALSRSTGDRLQNWMPDSRNLLRIARERQATLLRSGKLEVLGALARLPKTQHDSNSFSIDVPVANERLMQVSVCGVLKEREERHAPVRAFSRVFIIVPQGQGFCIINEMLVVTPATNEQIKAAFKPMAPTPSPSPIPHVQAVPGAAVALTDDVRRRMAEQLSALSGMNAHWSVKCLEENEYNYDRAVLVFNQLKAENKVPPEAFLPA